MSQTLVWQCRGYASRGDRVTTFEALELTDAPGLIRAEMGTITP